jgi:hypothetical protein
MRPNSTFLTKAFVIAGMLAMLLSSLAKADGIVFSGGTVVSARQTSMAPM